MQETLEMQVPSQGRRDPLEKDMVTPLQYSCLENPMDRGAWQATLHGVAKNQTWLKWLTTIPPTRKVPQASYSHPSECRQNENHNHTKLTKLITWITILSNSMKLWAMLCRATLDGRVMMGVLTKQSPLEKGEANHFSILTLGTPWTIWKSNKISHWKMNSPGQLVPNMLLEKSRKIAPEGMKRLSQSGNNTQLLMCLVVRVKYHAVKNNMEWEPGVSGPWIKANWKRSNRRRQEWTSTF